MNKTEEEEWYNEYSELGDAIARRLVAMEKKRRIVNLLMTILNVVVIAVLLYIVFKVLLSLSLEYILLTNPVIGVLALFACLAREYLRSQYKKELPQLIVDSVSPELRIDGSSNMLGDDNVSVLTLASFFITASNIDFNANDCICFRRRPDGTRKRGYILELDGNYALWTMPMDGITRKTTAGNYDNAQPEDKMTMLQEILSGLKAAKYIKQRYDNIHYFTVFHKLDNKQHLASMLLPSGESLLERMERLRGKLVGIEYMSSGTELRIGVEGNDLFICIPTQCDLFEVDQKDSKTIHDMRRERKYVQAYLSLYNDLNPDTQQPTSRGIYDTLPYSDKKIFSTPLKCLIAVMLCFLGYLEYSYRDFREDLSLALAEEYMYKMEKYLDDKEYDKCEQTGKELLDRLSILKGSDMRKPRKVFAKSADAGQLMARMYSYKKDSLEMFRHYRLAIDDEHALINAIGMGKYACFKEYVQISKMYYAMGIAYNSYDKRQEMRRHYDLAIQAANEAISIAKSCKGEVKFYDRMEIKKQLAEYYNDLAYSYASENDYDKALELIDIAIEYDEKKKYYDSKEEFIIKKEQRDI